MKRHNLATRVQEGRCLSGPRGRTIAANVISMIVVAVFATSARGQTVLPEQRLSSGISNVYYDPQLRASGTRVFGAWGGRDAPPTDISYGYSVDRGISWVNEATLPLIFGSYGSSPPFALNLGPSGVGELMAPKSSHFYFRRPLFDGAIWASPVQAAFALGTEDAIQSIASDPQTNSSYFAFTRTFDDPYECRIRFMRGLGGGATWTVPADLSSSSSNGSSMVAGPGSMLFITWVDYALGSIVLRVSADDGVTFSPPSVVAELRNNLNATPLGWSDPPGVSLRRYPYYREGVRQNAAPNFPALAVDRSEGPSRGTLYLAWADHADGVPAPAAVTYAQVEPNDNAGTAQLVTLDSNIEGFLWNSGHTGPVDRDWYAFDGQKGETIILDGTTSGFYSLACGLYEQMPSGQLLLGASQMLGAQDRAAGSHEKPPIFTLPRTGRYLLSLGGSINEQPSYQVRLRRYQVSPTSVARDMRDIVLIRSTDGGQTWSPRVRVNADAPGADQHQPNVAVDELGRIYVAWYDRRDSEFGDEVIPYASVSTDGGATFGPDLRLTQAASNWVGPNIVNSGTYPGALVGDRIAIAAGDNFGMVAWPDAREVDVLTLGMSIYAARIVDIPTAVSAVSDLTAEPVAGTVRLRWRVNDPHGIAGIGVLRADERGPEELIGAAAITGATGEAEYVDATAEPGYAYTYRLRITAGGESFHLGPVAVQTPARIDALAWRAAGPNPFAQRTSVTLAVPRAAEGAVRIYDVQGKVVRTLREGALEPGELRLDWDGRDAAGLETAPGLYFVAAQVGATTVRTKLTRVR